MLVATTPMVVFVISRFRLNLVDVIFLPPKILKFLWQQISQNPRYSYV